MKRLGIIGVIAMCALPAHGEQTMLTTAAAHALTPIDSVPTKESIIAALPMNTVSQLAAIASSDMQDVGIRLRAIRALPQFCQTPCKDTPPHQTLKSILQSLPALDQAGPTVLLLRAVIEALGVAKADPPGDVQLIKGLLDSPSRDIRAATAFALRDLCDQSAVPYLRTRYNVEIDSGVKQVQYALSEALSGLTSCTP